MDTFSNSLLSAMSRLYERLGPVATFFDHALERVIPKVYAHATSCNPICGTCCSSVCCGACGFDSHYPTWYVTSNDGCHNNFICGVPACYKGCAYC
jgi:hypothetical protein